MHRGFPKYGEVLITTEAPCGNVAQIDNENIALAQRVIKYRGKKEIDNTYLCYELQSFTFKKKLDSLSSGGTVKGIKGSTLHKTSIDYPAISEQKKIASLMSLIDKKIKKQQQLVELLKKYKKELLEKYFDENLLREKRVPFIKLSSILSFQNGINADATLYGKGTKYISVSDILNNDFITYDSITGLIDIDQKTLTQYSVTYGDILFQRSSENREDAGKSNVYLDEDNTATFGGFVIRGKKIASYNPRYIKYALDSFASRKQIMKYAAGAQHINVSQSDLSKIIIPFHNEEIQSKISKSIATYESKILAETQVLNKLFSMKKSLLQQLFI